MCDWLPHPQDTLSFIALKPRRGLWGNGTCLGSFCPFVPEFKGKETLLNAVLVQNAHTSQRESMCVVTCSNCSCLPTAHSSVVWLCIAPHLILAQLKDLVQTRGISVTVTNGQIWGTKAGEEGWLLVGVTLVWSRWKCLRAGDRWNLYLGVNVLHVSKLSTFT